MSSKNPEKKPSRKRKMKVLEHPRSSSEMFTNREIGWLNFNLRVLSEAGLSSNPLIERIKFLSISSSNLDEFFMKRVGGLKRQIAYGLSPKSSDGQTPKKQMAMISKALQPMLVLQKKLLSQFLKELAAKGCEIVHFSHLKTEERKFLKNYFKQQVFPILTPLSVDPGHPFPFISNLSISLGVSLVANKNADEEKIFARVKIPKLIDQWVQIGDSNKYIHIIEIVKAFVGDLFPQMHVVGSVVFKVTRNADSDREDDDAEDLLEKIEEELRQRRFAEVVRVEMSHCTDPWLKMFLLRELGIKEDDLYSLPAEFDLTDFGSIASKLSWPDDKFPAWSPVVPAVLENTESIFEAIKKQDILIHHPYESFSATVERFIAEAARDPHVLAIKMTLYRTGDNSPFIKSLIEAAESGKQVVCLIELKARFDEERNIYWAQELESAGVHVVYGLVGLKAHAKTSIVVRKEGAHVRTYAHIGTGNYNVVTSRFYTDVGLLTADTHLTHELIEFFNYLTGKSLKKDYQHLLLAPMNMFQKFKELIQRETEHAKHKRPAQIYAKFNNMEENDMSLALYEASKAGVDIRLQVRGFCCLKPQVKGLSDNIKVQSTIGRFLEHSRIFYFRNGKENPLDGDFFIGSADWMYRNLHARVEAVIPIYDRQSKEKLFKIIEAYWTDDVQTWQMKPSGEYHRKKVAGSHHMGVQAHLMKKAMQNNDVITEDEYLK